MFNVCELYLNINCEMYEEDEKTILEKMDSNNFLILSLKFYL